ncbi:cytochrome b562 [Pseudoalteromonas sp. SMS1]|uniref:cytochrome b562 n=1 Tax=Pseudoalteromonas sp. SMS1 TaxID=2908894 RepID=UPI001F2F4296|nr:cytochrome b562 [Pseudoalteromonas sp. SMS1]MCF2856053.1 cytochrome b562 [Pseudoalteromonas sp. SMS1]
MKFILIVAFLMSGLVYAETQDLNQIMKKMGHEYKLAIKSQSANEMQHHIDEFISLVELAKHQRFGRDQAKKSIKGLNLTIALAKQAAALSSENTLIAAKEKLKEIEALRVEYHKLHEPPGVWELLFGR